MGAAITKSPKLLKPDDCPQESWKKILQLFDRLDTDGTQSIEAGELMGNIAVLHVSNNIKQLRGGQQTLLTKMEFEKKSIMSDLEINIQQMRKEAVDRISNINSSYKENTERIETYIKLLNEMTLEEKSEKIKKTICGKKSSIEFWDFYKYMKLRTNDIPNIMW